MCPILAELIPFHCSNIELSSIVYESVNTNGAKSSTSRQNCHCWFNFVRLVLKLFSILQKQIIFFIYYSNKDLIKKKKYWVCVHMCVCVCVVRGMSSPDPRREQCDIVGIQKNQKKNNKR